MSVQFSFVFVSDGASRGCGFREMEVILGLWLLLQTFIADQTDLLPTLDVEEEDPVSESMHSILETLGEAIPNPLVSMEQCLHAFRLCTFAFYFNEELGFWVKPRSTTWFSRFLMEEYDDNRRFEMFRMRKSNVICLANVLASIVCRKDTKFRVAIPIIIRVVQVNAWSFICSLFRDVCHWKVNGVCNFEGRCSCH